MSKEFPKNFYWGASTSAHQIEGNLKNNWSIWEKEHSIKESTYYKTKTNKFPSYPIGEENIKEARLESNYISGIACDSYKKYKEDVKILKELGLNSYRFSIAWSRIEPEKGKYSKEAIQYYKSLVKELKDNKIEPFLTCWHWDIPVWLVEESGLLSKNIVEYFSRYIDFLVENLGEEVKYWMTINEPLVFTSAAYIVGKWPPQKRNLFKAYRLGFVKLAKMHKEGYRVIKKYDRDLQVSIAKNNQYVESYNKLLLNKGIASILRYINNYLFLDKVRDSLDYIGINYYAHSMVGVRGLRNTSDILSDMGWWMRPKSIFYVLKEVHDRYNLPVYITENGVADREGKYREWWLEQTVEAMQEALEYGVDLRGYMHWSLLDNFEWAEGYWPRFGLATRDREIKESGYYYRHLIKKYIKE
jgi:beta-glucosidase